MKQFLFTNNQNNNAYYFDSKCDTTYIIDGSLYRGYLADQNKKTYIFLGIAFLVFIISKNISAPKNFLFLLIGFFIGIICYRYFIYCLSKQCEKYQMIDLKIPIQNLNNYLKNNNSEDYFSIHAFKRVRIFLLIVSASLTISSIVLYVTAEQIYVSHYFIITSTMFMNSMTSAYYFGKRKYIIKI